MLNQEQALVKEPYKPIIVEDGNGNTFISNGFVADEEIVAISIRKLCETHYCADLPTKEEFDEMQKKLRAQE